MRHIRFLPLAFLAGVHGFDLFAPYAVAVLACLPFLVGLRRRRRAPVAVPAGIQDLQDHEAELLPGLAE